MTKLAQDLKVGGFTARTWQEAAPGTLVFTDICRAIHGHALFICEVTIPNQNVLFEMGYAIAVGRDPIAIHDTTRTGESMPILQTLMRCEYQNRQQIIEQVVAFAERTTNLSNPARIPRILATNSLNPGKRPSPGTVYWIPPRSLSDVGQAIDQVLDSSPLKLTRSDPTDELYDSFIAHARIILEAQVFATYLVSSSISDHSAINSQLAFLAGLATGFGRRVILLQELPNRNLIDIGTMVRQFSNEDEAQSQCQAALDVIETELLSDPSPQPRQMPGVADRRQTIKGAYLGSLDSYLDSSFNAYAIRTPIFDLALAGTPPIVIGRRGSGKSALFVLVVDELGRIPTQIVVDVATDPAPNLPSLISRIFSGYGPNWGGLQTRWV